MMNKLMRLTAHLCTEKGKIIKRLSTTNARGFSRFLQNVSLTSHRKMYFRISYGKGTNVFGEVCEFVNEGIYTSRKKLINAFKAFYTA